MSASLLCENIPLRARSVETTAIYAISQREDAGSPGYGGGKSAEPAFAAADANLLPDHRAARLASGRGDILEVSRSEL